LACTSSILAVLGDRQFVLVAAVAHHEQPARQPLLETVRRYTLSISGLVGSHGMAPEPNATGRH